LLILPLIGTIDEQRVEQVVAQLLNGIRAHRAKVVVVDVTGVAAVDAAIVRRLVDLVEASRLMGARIIFTGMGKGFSEAILSAGTRVDAMTSVGDLQRGIEEAERFLGTENGAAPSVQPFRLDSVPRSRT